MLDLPGHPLLDKARLIGACSRLGLTVDGPRLRREIDSLREESWAGTGGRVGVHARANAIFLRGFAPAEGEKPIEDREALAALPYAREIITQVIPAPAQRCLLARLLPGVSVAGHIDRAPYFGKTIRIHVPVTSNEAAWMYCDGLAYRMRPGEVWALNNSAPHAVWNAHAGEARIHLICDFLPTAALLELLAHAQRDLGAPNAELDRVVLAAR
jgi:hypothetical protein